MNGAADVNLNHYRSVPIEMVAIILYLRSPGQLRSYAADTATCGWRD